MKKKVLAMLLAAVMVMALLPTAFAADADSDPGITVNVQDLEALRIEETTFRLRDWNPAGFDEESDKMIFAKGEPVNHASADLEAYELPLGVTLTIRTATTSTGIISGQYVTVNAWSDPDRDGIYDGRTIVQDETYWPNPLPASEEGPVKAWIASDIYFGVNDDGVSELLPVDGFMWSIPTTFQVTSDYLTEYFGANTLIQIKVLTDRETWTYDEYYFLLTGEQAGSGTEDPAEPETPDFPDVLPGAYYAGAVAWAVKEGYVTGKPNGLFEPLSTCSEAEILTLLYNVYSPTYTGEAPFADSLPDYCRDAVNWAYENNMISDSFQYTAPCTRATTIYFLWLANGAKSPAGKASFPDVNADDYYASAVAWAEGEGIVSGNGSGLFDPDTIFNRGMVATLVYKTLVPEART